MLILFILDYFALQLLFKKIEKSKISQTRLRRHYKGLGNKIKSRSRKTVKINVKKLQEQKTTNEKINFCSNIILLLRKTTCFTPVVR